MKPTVTVIIPTTGQRPNRLPGAVRSALGQLRPPERVVVVVDGDDGRERAVRACLREARIESAQITFARTPGDGSVGASAARNLGTRLAQTSFLAFLDDDDRWKQQYLQRVFDTDSPFDVALCGFEKHTPEGVRPEKVPPEALTPDRFLVSNPGLRGSNLVVRRTVMLRLGGFDERLPAFNDLDFGVRLARDSDVAYRRITDYLVEFHRHDEPRLSSPGCPANREGMAGFLLLHAPDMTHLQEAAFRRRGLKLWGVDPWAPQVLRRRLESASQRGCLGAHMRSLLHASESVLLEYAWSGRDHSDVQKFIDETCACYERANDRPRPPRLTFAVTTTDTAGGLQRLVHSLVAELDETAWARRFLPERPIDLLVVENDTVEEIAEQHARTLRALEEADGRIEVHHLRWADKRGEAPKKPWSLARSRAFLLDELRRRGWYPGRDRLVWLLDEDMVFAGLLPDPARVWRTGRVGSVLHRIEALAAEIDADAIVGGNTGAAPVPALTLVGPQFDDLMATAGLGHPSDRAEVSLKRLADDPEYYYALASPRPGPGMTLPLTTGWYDNELCNSSSRTDSAVSSRLEQGLPITRPLPQRVDQTTGSAWGKPTPAEVAGGNVLLLSPALLRPEWFVELSWEGGRSRRADSGWVQLARRSGASVVNLANPLLHDRRPRGRVGQRAPSSRSVADRSAALVRGLVEDTVGVGLYRTLARLGAPDGSATWWEAWAESYEARRCRLVEMLSETRHKLDRLVPLLPSWQGLFSVQVLQAATSASIPAAVDLLATMTSREMTGGTRLLAHEGGSPATELGYWERRRDYPYYGVAIELARGACAKPSRVLDVGAADCEYAFEFLPDARVTLVDPIERPVSSLPPGARFVHGQFEELDLAPADLVLCLQVLEHVREPGRFAEKLLSLARTALVVSVPYKLRHPIAERRHLPIDRNTMREWFGRPADLEVVTRGEVYRGVEWRRLIQLYEARR